MLTVAEYVINVVNLCQNGDNFTVEKWRNSEAPFAHHVNNPDVPGTQMKPNVNQTLSWYDNTFGGEPISNGYMIIKTPKGRFGVNLHVPARTFALGTSPYYQIWHNESGEAFSEKSWPFETPGNAVTPYNFPAAVGYNVRIEPEHEAHQLKLSVTIQPLT